jgi:DNA repair exonuclease SbcCD ATPase subunit
MSNTLPGAHYCENHQGNHSHYAKHNCEMCKLSAQLAEREARLTSLNMELQRAFTQQRESAEVYRFIAGACLSGTDEVDAIAATHMDNKYEAFNEAMRRHTKRFDASLHAWLRPLRERAETAEHRANFAYPYPDADPWTVEELAAEYTQLKRDFAVLANLRGQDQAYAKQAEAQLAAADKEMKSLRRELAIVRERLAEQDVIFSAIRNFVPSQSVEGGSS